MEVVFNELHLHKNIVNLNALREIGNQISVRQAEGKGKGPVHEVLLEIVEEIEKIHKSMDVLLESTVCFLENSQRQIRRADEASAYLFQ